MVDNASGDKPQMVPIADVLAQKAKVKKLEERLNLQTSELAQTQVSIKKLEGELKVAKASGEDDEEIKKIKQSLIEEFDKLRAEQDKHQKDLTSFTEREKKVRASELVAQAKTQYGVDLKVDDVLESDNPELRVKEICLETLAKQKAETPPAGSVYESGTGGITKKQPRDMSDSEFKAFVATQTKEALSKK